MFKYRMTRKMRRRATIEIEEEIEVEAGSRLQAVQAAVRGEGDVMDYTEPKGVFEYDEDDVLDCGVTDVEIIIPEKEAA